MKKNSLKKGFTLAEMLIVIAIVAVISTVVLFGYREFSDRLSLASAAQEIAIAIRESQAYGVSVRETGSGTQDFDNAYGIYFDINNPTIYYLYSDLNDDQKYDHTNDCIDECISKEQIRNGIYVSQICGTPFSGVSRCPVNPSVIGINISFKRPNPDAKIRFTNPGYEFFGNLYQTGGIVLMSPLGNTVTINIENTGQISID